MHRILVADCEQEISSFNPRQSDYDLFDVHRGVALLAAHDGADTCLRGALDVLSGKEGVEAIPVYGATACSAGPLSQAAFDRIAAELVAAVEAAAAEGPVTGMYFSLHGAMGAETELDPEGFLLKEVRRILGPEVPIVASLDLHAVLTRRMLECFDAAAVYHTYPHQDFVSTGQRAARLLMRIVEGDARPTAARIFLPILVRGPELMTATGLYGEVIDRAKEMEDKGEALSAAMIISNPFTDAPELGSHALVYTNGDPEAAERLARELMEMFLARHERMTAELLPVGDAIADAKRQSGTVTFTDAADAPSSGASGDGNAILRALLDAGYEGSVIMPIVDAPAAARAHAEGVGARFNQPLGGTIDPARFPPIPLEVEVERLGDGEYLHEVSRRPAHAGPTAVLRHGAIRIVVLSRPVFMMDRAVFLAHGLDPTRADLVVVKSPGAFARYFTFAVKNYVPDVPGATSANLGSLGFRVCERPMFPIDPGVSYDIRVEHFPAAGVAAA